MAVRSILQLIPNVMIPVPTEVAMDHLVFAVVVNPSNNLRTPHYANPARSQYP
jgi:hypothetical protein